MENLTESSKKQTEEKRFRKHIGRGSLLTVAAESLFLGRGKTAKEIIRLSTHLKTMRKIQKNMEPVYGSLISSTIGNLSMKGAVKYGSAGFRALIRRRLL